MKNISFNIVGFYKGACLDPSTTHWVLSDVNFNLQENHLFMIILADSCNQIIVLLCL